MYIPSYQGGPQLRVVLWELRLYINVRLSYSQTVSPYTIHHGHSTFHYMVLSSPKAWHYHILIQPSQYQGRDDIFMIKVCKLISQMFHSINIMVFKGLINISFTHDHVIHHIGICLHYRLFIIFTRFKHIIKIHPLLWQDGWYINWQFNCAINILHLYW